MRSEYYPLLAYALNDNDTYETDEKYEMYEVDSSDVDVSDGKLYRTILNIDSAEGSSLAYRFYASDGGLDATNGAASGDPIDDVANTIIFANNPPVLTWTAENGYSADFTHHSTPGCDGGPWAERDPLWPILTGEEIP